jgi:hypothetical protein
MCAAVYQPERRLPRHHQQRRPPYTTPLRQCDRHGRWGRQMVPLLWRGWRCVAVVTPRSPSLRYRCDGLVVGLGWRCRHWLLFWLPRYNGSTLRLPHARVLPGRDGWRGGDERLLRRQLWRRLLYACGGGSGSLRGILALAVALRA